MEWSFSVSAYDKYLCLMQKSRIAPFLLLSNIEYVMSIELHYETFITITVDSNTQDQLHSIVIATKVPTSQFNIGGLLDTIGNTPCKIICDNLKSIQWKPNDGLDLFSQTLHQR
jgi:hypothetical protein